MIRDTLREWQSKPSDTGGCTTLHSPKPVKPELGPQGLLDPKVPFLLLLEEAYRLGWTEQTRHRPCVVSTSPHAGVMSKDKLSHRVRSYFACLITLGTLFNRGLTRFQHSLSSAYYQRLLQADRPQDIDPTSTAEQHEVAVKLLAPPVLAPTVREAEDDGFVWSEHSGSVSDRTPSSGEDRRKRGGRRKQPRSDVGSDAWWW